jgi:hypothetical protein
MLWFMRRSLFSTIASLRGMVTKKERKLVRQNPNLLDFGETVTNIG